MPILDQKFRYYCVECGQQIDVDPMYLKTAPKYCYPCRNRKRDNWKRGINNPGRNTKKGKSKFIMANIDWYNAGLVAGVQGYLRDKFYSLLGSEDFLSAMDALKTDKKYLAEIHDLTDTQRQVWLIGFFAGINKVVRDGHIVGCGVYYSSVNNCH